MPEQNLRDRRILVVEDEYMLADDLRAELDEAGAVVVGPAGTVEDAMALIGSGEPIDGAVLDVNLRGEPVFPAADLLAERGVPFLFTTGYDQSAIPERFERVPRCEKPIDMARVAREIGRAIHA